MKNIELQPCDNYKISLDFTSLSDALDFILFKTLDNLMFDDLFFNDFDEIQFD